MVFVFGRLDIEAFEKLYESFLPKPEYTCLVKLPLFQRISLVTAFLSRQQLAQKPKPHNKYIDLALADLPSRRVLNFIDMSNPS